MINHYDGGLYLQLTTDQKPHEQKYNHVSVSLTLKICLLG